MVFSTLSMFPFRKKTFFHIEPSVSDPEILVLRFRRRILAIACLGSLIILAVPVFKDLNDWFVIHSGIYKFTQFYLKTKTDSSLKRVPMSLELSPDHQTWIRKVYAPGVPCKNGSQLLQDFWANNETRWNMTVKGELKTGTLLCFYPGEGLKLIDSSGVIPFAPLEIQADSSGVRSSEQNQPRLRIEEEANRFSIDFLPGMGG